MRVNTIIGLCAIYLILNSFSWSFDKPQEISNNLSNIFNIENEEKGLFTKKNKSRPPCMISINSATPSSCNSGTNTYSLDVVVTYIDPVAGNIDVTTSNGGAISVAQTGSPQTITLTGLASNGLQDIDVTAVFASDVACTNTLMAAYDAPNSCFAQVQSEFETPSILTACNLDTICLQIRNLEGLKNASYGDATVQINLPNADLLNVLPGSVFSNPAGAVQTSYVDDILTVTLPMPAFGSTTEICFVVRPSCEITSISPLPQLHATIDYPAGYPLASESVSSVPMNVGAVSLTHTLYDQTTYGNPSPAFGTSFRVISWIRNTGYGNQKEVTYKIVVPKVHGDGSIRVYPVSTAGAYDYTGGYASKLSSEEYDAEHNLVTFLLTGANLGPDGILSPDERIRFDHYTVATNECATFATKRWPELSCGENEPVCIIPDTLYSTITQAAGTPKLDGTIVSIEDADGCPDKHGVFKVKNNGTGSGTPVGNAYDVDLSISFGSGLMILSNIQMNGMTVPMENLTPDGLAATSTTILLKDKMTTDPDGAGVGIEDLDMDGFFDDMMIGAETEISFDYTIPCNLACGAQLDYKLASVNTFTDFCRTLAGRTSTQLHRFGFEQVQAIEQMEEIDYGTLGVGDSAIRTAKFQFQYKQHNMDFTNATGELRIAYMNRMELDPTTILLNGVAPTNTPVLLGDNSTGAVPDNDSMYVVALTAAELTALFDETTDTLWYDQTYYGCDIRQDNNVGDTWTLIVKVNQSLCSDGSEACSFDVGCKKPFVYTYNTGCGTKPCYIQELSTYRESPRGYTGVDETAQITDIDSSRSWTGDTVVLRNGFYITGDQNHEPNGFYSAQGSPHLDLRTEFALKYTKPVGWNGTNTIWTFLPTYSTVCVYERTPDADPLKKGTIGAKITEVPIILSDFAPNGSSGSATMQNSFNSTEHDYGDTEYGDPVWYCNNSPTSWHVSGTCPIQNKFWRDLDYNNIHYLRYMNVADDKISETYYLNIGKALARGGWTGNTGDDNFYYEVKVKWQMNEDFPWDNTNSFGVVGYSRHLGDYLSHPGSYHYNHNSSYNGPCGTGGTTHLTTTKEPSISNPNSVYSGDCNLKVNHDIFLKSNEGDFFGGGEVRVPLKIDSIVIDLPSEYGVTPGTFNWKYNQGCGDLNSVDVAASASTGHIAFTNSTGGDFPRADDCAGNKVAYQLCYTIEKTGTAIPTQYRFPIKIYGRDDTGIAVILTDSATISEAKPQLTLTPLSPILTPADGGSCEPSFFDFQIQNNTAYDAGYTYLAAESNSDITMVWVDDGDNIYSDPIDSNDVSTYGASSIFAKLGTIKSGEIRKVRVYGNTNTCGGNFNVYVDFGCDYPSPLAPNLGSATIQQTSAQYQAQNPQIANMPVAEINVVGLCDIQTVEVEVRNIRLGNLYKGNVLFDLPAGASLVAESAEYIFPNAAIYSWDTIPSSDVSQPTASEVNLDLSNINPFNTACGLPGSDEFNLSHYRVRFDIEFNACPTSSKDYITYIASGENFCGVQASTQGVLQINYNGNSTSLNDYSIAAPISPIEVCARLGETQIVSDTFILTNVGGYGTSSGTSTGMETSELTTLFDTTNFQISGITLNPEFNSPTISYDADGNLMVSSNVPAGIDVDSSILMILTYNLVSKVPDICALASTAMCYSLVVKTSRDISCPAKGLTCAASFTSIAGHEFTVRTFDCCQVDYGDLPDLGDGTTGINDYETNHDNGGPSHIIIDGLMLGAIVDAELDGAPDNLAEGDDTGDGNDDEDGVVIFPTLDISPGSTIRLPLSVTNTTGDTAYVEAWIDWNGDGDFDAGEMVADFKDNKDGVFPSFMEITVPVDAVTGSLLGFRVRLSNTDNMTPYGRIDTGEIEDYLLGLDCPQVICLPIEFELKRG